MFLNLACTRTCLSSLQGGPVGLRASLKEQFSLLNVGFVKADNNSFVD